MSTPKDRLSRLRRAILRWFGKHQRDLPWRRTEDPYAIWVSEIMLQQTRVETVIPYYERFLQQWPDVRALAEAPEEAVRARWSGLGYYRRASLMIRAARTVVADHSGRFPQTYDALLTLPGLGPYTAGAIASIAFDREVPAVDGNVLRVLARVDGIEGDVTRGAPNRAVVELAAALAKGRRPGDLNQALMEMGATVCAPKNPDCPSCPARALCRASADGTTDRIPAPKAKPKRARIEVTALLFLDGGKVLLERQPSGGLFEKLWCLPMLEGHLEGKGLRSAAREKYALELDDAATVSEVKHVLTHRDILMRIVRVTGPKRTFDGHLRLVELARLDALGIPSITSRALRSALPTELLAEATLPGRMTSNMR